LTDALAEYKNERSNLTRDVSTSRDQTNEKSSQLFKVFGQMQRELHCMISVNVTTDISNTDQLVTDYKHAIDKEIKVTEELSTQQGDSKKLQTLVSSFNKYVVNELAEIKLLRGPEFKEKYASILDTFKGNLKNKPDTTTLQQARKQIKLLKSKFRHKQADLSDLEEEESDGPEEVEMRKIEEELDEIRLNLHEQFIIEQKEMIKLAEAFKGNFPEIAKIYPELGIEEFSESNNLWQRSRVVDHYLGMSSSTLKTQSKQNTHKCMFNGEPCILKEISVQKDKELLKTCIQKLIDYSKEERKNCTKIHAIFTDKAERKLYYHQDFATEGNIVTFLKTSNPEPEVLKSICKEYLVHLASSTTLHGGIKLENLLVTKFGDSFKGVVSEANLINNNVNQSSSMENYPKVGDILSSNPDQADLISLAGFILWVFHRDYKFSNDSILDDVENGVQEHSLKELLKRVLCTPETVTVEDVLTSQFFANDDKQNKEGEIDNDDVTKEIANLKLDDTVNGYDTSTFLDDTGLSTDINENYVTSVNGGSILPGDEDSILEEGEDDDDDDESIVADKSVVDDDGSEIDAWEKALKDRKSAKKSTTKLAPEDISISDDDDF